MKRLIALLLILCLSLLAVGCGNTQQLPTPREDIPTVVDGSGRFLAIPEDAQDTAIASVYAVAAPFLVALELTDRVVAVNVKSYFWTDADAHLAAAGSVGRGTVDLEALAEIGADVLIHRSNDEPTVTAVTEKLGLPVICITVEDVDDIKETLTMLGAYFGAEARAAEVCAWLDGKFALIDEIVATIPAEERATALVMGGELGRIAGGDMLQSWMIEKAGGLCVAQEITDNRNWVNAGVETVFAFDPDYIFCTSSTALNYSIDSILADPAWTGLVCVQQEQIYQIPAKIDTWDMPGISCALGTMFLLHSMYPDYFSADQLEMEIAEYYTFMFGQTFDRDYLGYALEN